MYTKYIKTTPLKFGGSFLSSHDSTPKLIIYGKAQDVIKNIKQNKYRIYHIL